MIHTDEIRRAVCGREVEVLAAFRINPPLRGHIRCPFPDHEDVHPSWRWDFIEGRFYCTCGTGDLFDVIQQIRGGGFIDALRFSASVLGIDDATTTILLPRRPQPPPRRKPEGKRWSGSAEGLWTSCMPLSGVALDYLHARNCAIPPEDGDLRWHPDLPHHRTGRSGPALVARVTDAVTNEPMTLHRTWIMPGGRKADFDPPRMWLAGHQKGGGVVRLWPDEEVTLGLGIGEGIETALSAALGFTPVWSALDAGNLEIFPVLDGVEALTIFADNDEAGHRAANQCAVRWLEAGREVRSWSASQAGLDFNDWVVA